MSEESAPVRKGELETPAGDVKGGKGVDYERGPPLERGKSQLLMLMANRWS